MLFAPRHRHQPWQHLFFGQTSSSSYKMTSMAMTYGEVKLPECSLPGCQKDVYYDFRSGLQHDYCGRTHAKQGLSQQGQTLWEPHGCCHECKLTGCEETVAYEADTGRVHDFCCLTHAQEALHNGEWKHSDKKPRRKKRTREGHPTGEATCTLFGCSAKVWEDPSNNQKYDYCSRSHADLAKQRGELPPSDTTVARSFQGQSSLGLYSLNLLKNTHEKYVDVKHQFLTKWEKSDPRSVQVVRIYQIRNPEPVYNNFMQCVAARGTAPVVRRFHGTQVLCQVGVDPNAGPCNDASCPLCNICRSGFSMDFVNQHTGSQAGWLRYGPGLYFSPCSGKSNDYTVTSAVKPGPRGQQSVPHRSMLLCKVALGRNKSTFVDEQNLTKNSLLQQGFDSISGLVAPQGSGIQGTLNYPEDVVYEGCAAIPSYLIVYSLY
jgi:hypothetical protein